jgi:ATP-dependent RNA helicase SUPV3L1/SUV3
LELVVAQFGRKTLHKLRRNILQHMLGSSPDADGPLHDDNSNSTLEVSSSETEPDFPAGEQPGWYSNSCSSSSDEEQAQQQQEATARAFQGVGMVYGALPPESRRTQAALFNARGDVWPRTSVLVASDAVGMGLNLNIRRWVYVCVGAGQPQVSPRGYTVRVWVFACGPRLSCQQ